MARKDIPGQVDFEGKVAPAGAPKPKPTVDHSPIKGKRRQFNLTGNLILDDRWKDAGESVDVPLVTKRKTTPEEVFAFNIDTKKKNRS